MNNINRHNYETYFLLYTDNELSVAERKAVEDFVQNNPDLLEELEMLQQSIVKPENIAFDKKGLLKREGIPYPVLENLLLHLDNELTHSERKKMDGIIEEDAGIEKEWAIIQQTKLSPDSTIVFEDKESLYREESGRLVAYPWWRLAVAAVFIGFGVWGGLSYLNSTSNPVEEVVVKNNQTKSDEIRQDTNSIAIEDKSISEVEKETTGNKGISKNVTAISNPKLVARKVVAAKVTIGNMRSLIEEKEENNVAIPNFDNVNINESNKSISTHVLPENTPNIIEKPGNNDIGEKENPSNVFASSTSLTDEGDENNNHILFLDEEKIKKTKLSGVFRKVKRVIERNVNIKTGSGNFKVANLEFAIQ